MPYLTCTTYKARMRVNHPVKVSSSLWLRRTRAPHDGMFARDGAL